MSATSTSTAISTRKPGAELPIAVRGAIVALKALALNPEIPVSASSAQIASWFAVSKREVDRLFRQARERQWDPIGQLPLLSNTHVERAARSGAPKKVTQPNREAVAQIVSFDAYAREKTCETIADELTQKRNKISTMTVWRLLRTAGFKKTRPTRKPGLTENMQRARLDFCLQHKH